MNIRDYTRLAARFDNHSKDSGLDAYVEGLLAEAGEVIGACYRGDSDEILLELGDVMWNLAAIARVVVIDPGDIEEAECEKCPGTVITRDSLAMALLVQATKVSGLMEKSHRVGRQMAWEDMASAVLIAWKRWSWLTTLAGFTPDEVRQANLSKLSERYREAS